MAQKVSAMKNTELTTAIVDEQGQIMLPPMLCRQLGWEAGRHLLAFQRPCAEAVLALPTASYLLLVEPMTLYKAIQKAQEAVRQADVQQVDLRGSEEASFVWPFRVE